MRLPFRMLVAKQSVNEATPARMQALMNYAEVFWSERGRRYCCSLY